MDNTAVFLGAGFSKACGLPTTAELGREFLRLGPTGATDSRGVQDVVSSLLARFWTTVFGWPGSETDLPSLEDHFTLVDLAANSGHNIGTYTPRQLRAIRRLSIHRVFDLLDQTYIENRAAVELFRRLHASSNTSIVTTNWDTAVERSLADANIPYSYGIEAFHPSGDSAPRGGLPILKLHGSSNWMYCDNCRRTVVGGPYDGKTALHSGAFLRHEDVHALDPVLGPVITAGMSGRLPAPKCHFCHVDLTARVATFSYRKALGFFQFQNGWDRSLAQLRAASRWLFIGYSLPQADFEIRALLKTAQLSDLYTTPARTIDVVVGTDHQAQSRYRGFFGSHVTVHPCELDEWWYGHERDPLVARPSGPQRDGGQ